MTKLICTLSFSLVLMSCATEQVPIVTVLPVQAEQVPIVTVLPVQADQGELPFAETSYDPEVGEAVRRAKKVGSDKRYILIPQPIISEIEFPEIQGDLFAIYLFRHAEKQKGDNPELTERGQARAQFLAERFSNQSAEIQKIWSSDYRRTRQTAQPLAEKLGIGITIYNPREQQALMDQLLEDRVDALVVGHSNTIPDLAGMLCQCEVKPMDESEYERGFMVVFGRGVNIASEIDMRLAWRDRPEQTD